MVHELFMGHGPGWALQPHYSVPQYLGTGQ